VLVLDEPTNGLDPAGVHWLRALVRERADRGGAVLISSHLLAELALAADDVVIVKGGRLVTSGPVVDVTRGGPSVLVRTPEAERLRDVLRAAGVAAELAGPDEVLAHDVGAEAVGRAVAAAGLVVYEMRVQLPDLEQAFLALTAETGQGR
jgi:ABC-2 type transport system ATP-binding protein